MADVASSIAIGAAGEALGSLIVRFTASVYGALKTDLEPEIDVSTFMLTDEDGAQILLTESDMEDIAEFINTAEVAALAQGYVLLRAVRAHYKDATKSLRYLRNAFNQCVTDWAKNRPLPWTRSADAVWKLLIAHLHAVAPQASAVARVGKAESARLIDSSNQAANVALPPAPRYIRRIIEATSSPSRVSEIRELCADICNAAGEASEELHLEHAQERHRFGYDELYVERTLHAWTPAHASLADVFVATPISGVRLVVVGNPGVGKSTLVTRLVNKISTMTSANLAPVLVRCREITADVGNAAIEHVIHSATSLGISADQTDVEHLLSLGRCFVIFDGVDEVTDIHNRRRLISAIEVLAATYPLASIIYTTRKVGYEGAQFAEGAFPTFELQEYSTDQVHEYAERWFTAMQRPRMDAAAFLRESAEIDDVRRNPLMLSLLCTLYRVRGYIPMNQRDVYKQCADLLFHSWDALRHIPQPVDHKRYGHTLMEELADFFYKFPPSAGGVEERQLTKIIAAFFADTAGVDPKDAEVRARDFLEYCAGRAWLLTAVGHSSRGERLFAFTHRTFMEYYASEAIVHRAQSQVSVMDSILDAYRKNPSSVLPDLMFQAYDDKAYRGSESLLRDLMKEGKEGRKVAAGKHIPLCLRVLNSTPVGVRLVNEVLIQALGSWRNTNPTSQDDRREFVSLLQLYKDPRTICGRLLNDEGYAARELSAYVVGRKECGFGEEPDVEFTRGEFRRAFLSRWARIYFSGDGDLYTEDWSSIVARALDAESSRVPSYDAAMLSYLALHGKIDHSSANTKRFPLTLRCFDSPELGMYAIGAVKYVFGIELMPAEDAATRTLHESLSKRVPSVRFHDARRLDEAIMRLYRRSEGIGRRPGTDPPHLVEVALWLACVDIETNPAGVALFVEELNTRLGDNFLYRCLRHRFRGSRKGELAGELVSSKVFSGQELANLAETHPSWLVNWLRGRKNFVAGSDD